MAKNNQIPAIRFTGYTEEWEQKKLNEVSWFQEGPGLRNWQFTDKGIKVINVTNLEYGFLNLSRTNRYISYFEYNKMYKHFSIDENDIVIASSGNSYGKVSIVRRQDLPLLMNTSVIRFKAINGMDFEYLNTFLKSYHFKFQIDVLITGGAQPNFGPFHLNKIEIPVPNSLTEQIQIGNYFKELDTLIQSQEQKLEKVKNLKSAMLVKMFPAENSDTPEIRFKAFTDKWEEVTIKNVCSISTGKSNTQDRKEEGEFPFYVRSATIEKSNRFLFEEEAVLTVGDGVGTGKVFHYVEGKYDLHQRVYRMFNFQEILGKYFYYIFSNGFYKRVMSMTAKTSVDSVRLDMIAEMKIKKPRIQEQEQIVHYLDNLDQLITQSQQKAKQLKNLKQALLQKMFI